MTPTRSYSPLACPDAPRHRRRQPTMVDDELPPRILIPTIDSHRNRGILAGDFIKPDYSSTMSERRAHILHELQNWLVNNMRIQIHAKEVEYNCFGPSLEIEVATGTWPAGRLCLVAERGNFDRIQNPQERYHTAATWAYWVCYNYLVDGTEPVNEQEELAIGFVTVDRLPGGGTIADLWDWSPTTPLRVAPPLPDDDTDTESIVSDTENDNDNENTVCNHRVRVEAPIWLWSVVFLGFTFYVWLVAYLVDSKRH